MISPNQIAARAALQLSQGALASLSGISRATLAAIEGGSSDFRISSVRAIEAAIEEKGLVVRGDKVFERVSWPQGRPSDPELRSKVLYALNASRSGTNLPQFIDEDTKK